MAKVRLNQLTKRFGSVTAVENVNLELADGELLVLVGPSGCGKTTVLRMLAGLEAPTEGEIWIGDRLVNDLDPAKRNIAMVFQNFALYPHMTVRENLIFPLEERNLTKQEIEERVQKTARILQIEPLLERRPKEMSGGQQQRVAVGRAIIRNPSVLLMDEPLSNLDAKLRVGMRTELKRLQSELDVTTVYVTHDQTEALTMGDRIVIMGDGEIKQIGTADEVYQYPANIFVAGLIGSPPMNLLPLQVRHDNGQTQVVAHEFALPLPEIKAAAVRKAIGDGAEVMAGVRPEDLVLAPANSSGVLEGIVEVIEPLGSDKYLSVRWHEHVLMVRASSKGAFTEQDQISISVDPSDLHLFDPTTEQRIA
jgi:multiple sugar transport system ATP-binding protein